MSVGQIAALLAAVAFVLLVLLLAVPLIKLGRTLDEVTVAIRKAHEGTGPPPDEVGTTVTTTHPEVQRVDATTGSAPVVPAVPAGTRAPSPVLTAALGGPLIKVAALSYGVRKATRARRLAAEAEAAAAASRRRPRGARRART